MRMTPAQVEILLNLIAPKIQRQDTYMRDAISARVKLEITVLYISSGISYRLMFIFFRVSKASITKLIPEMCDAINRSLKDFIKIPSMEERQAIQVGLDSRLDFPGCCGDVDGKHPHIRVLGKSIQVKENTAIKIVLCACTLHNWLRTTAPRTYTPPGTADYEDIMNMQINLGQWRSEIDGLRSIQRPRINNRSKAAAE
nr:unnamed protein product [Callosobruchus analis]